MRRIKPFLIAAFERSMDGDQLAVLEDVDGIGKHVNIEGAAPRRIGHAVEIAADAHHALVRDTPLKSQHRSVGNERQRLQHRPSSAKASLTTRCVVASTRTLATCRASAGTED